jgi:hypothetical protein
MASWRGRGAPGCSAYSASPTLFPRTDLVATFLTGIAGINQPAHVKPAEMLRLNTSTPVTPAASQNRLGVIGGDPAGYPNGRRPGDDLVDITLRVAMGRLITLGLFGNPSQAPSGRLDFTDRGDRRFQLFRQRVSLSEDAASRLARPSRPARDIAGQPAPARHGTDPRALSLDRSRGA